MTVRCDNNLCKNFKKDSVSKITSLYGTCGLNVTWISKAGLCYDEPAICESEELIDKTGET